MKTITIIHIIGTEQAKRICLKDLQKQVPGTVLNFNSKSLDDVKHAKDVEAHCLQWIRRQVKDDDTIITHGLPIKIARIWIKRAYPHTNFRNLIWELHHHDEEKDWKYQVKKFYRQLLGISRYTEIPAGSPLRTMIGTDHFEIHDHAAIISSEVMDPKLRQGTIEIIAKMLHPKPILRLTPARE